MLLCVLQPNQPSCHFLWPQILQSKWESFYPTFVEQTKSEEKTTTTTMMRHFVNFISICKLTRTRSALHPCSHIFIFLFCVTVTTRDLRLRTKPLNAHWMWRSVEPQVNKHRVFAPNQEMKIKILPTDRWMVQKLPLSSFVWWLIWNILLGVFLSFTSKDNIYLAKVKVSYKPILIVLIKVKGSRWADGTWSEFCTVLHWLFGWFIWKFHSSPLKSSYSLFLI